VTEKGALYTRGNASGLGHTDGQAKQVPTLVAPHLLQDERVGRCHDLLPMHALAFAMSTYAQLGSAAPTVAAGGSSQRRSQRQQGKTPAAANKGQGLCVCHDAGQAGAAGGRGVCVVAGVAGGWAGGVGTDAGRRYDEIEGVNVKVKVTIASF